MTREKRIGRYRLKELLARSSGDVTTYLAHDDELMNLVKINVFPKSYPQDQLEKRLTNARAICTLEHPNILPIYDVGRATEGEGYVVSPFFDGVTLRQRVNNHPLSFEESAKLIATMAQALHFAHQHHCVHGNLSLGCVQLRNSIDDCVLSDFVLPNLEDGRKGTVITGMLQYMSPEQARGERRLMDGRSDVFSLGSMFYKLLTGQRPFQGDWREVLQQITSDDTVSPRTINQKVPFTLDRICRKAMEKRASDRYCTAAEFAEELSDWQTNVSQS